MPPNTLAIFITSIASNPGYCFRQYLRALEHTMLTWRQFDRWVNTPTVEERGKYPMFLEHQFSERNEAARRALQDSLEHGLQSLVQKPTRPYHLGS